MDATAGIIRSFIALNIPVELHETIGRIQDRLRYFPGASAIRWTRTKHLHITLHFLGDIDAAQVPVLIEAAREICAQEPALNLTLTGAGCFPSYEKPSVVWLGVAGDTDRLVEIRRRFLERAGPTLGEFEIHPFVPHLTLGRVKNGCYKTARIFGTALKSVESKIGVVGKWQARCIQFMRSELTTAGSVYTELGRIELTQP